MPKDNDISLDKNDPLLNPEEELESFKEDGSAYAYEKNPTSQAILDMQEAGLTPGEAVGVSKPGAMEANKSKALKDTNDHSSAETLVRIAKFRWFVLLVLSLASTAAWAVEAQLMGRPYNILAWGLLGLTILLSLVTTKFLRLPTRAGLAALGWSASFFISALYGPPADIFHIPAALPWGGVLVLIILWVAVAIWRKLGRYKVVDLILSVFLVYATLCPLWSIVDSYMMGQALALNFDVLTASPTMITSNLPWFMWPMTVMIAVILPLAALLAMGDQISALKHKGKRHGGNLFLSLAFILLIPYGFLSFNQAVTENPQWASMLRSNFPGAAAFVAALPTAEPKNQEELVIRAVELTPAMPTGPGTITESETITTETTIAKPEGSKTPEKPILAKRLIPAKPAEPEVSKTPEKPILAKRLIPAKPAEPETTAAQPSGTPAKLLAPTPTQDQDKDQDKTPSTPLDASAEGRLAATELELANVKKQLEQLEKQLEALTSSLAQPLAPKKNTKVAPLEPKTEDNDW